MVNLYQPAADSRALNEALLSIRKESPIQEFLLAKPHMVPFIKGNTEKDVGKPLIPEYIPIPKRRFSGKSQG